MPGYEGGGASPGTSGQTNRKLHKLGKRRSTKSDDDETGYSSDSSAASIYHPAYIRHQPSNRNDALSSNIKRQRLESEKRTMVNEERLQLAENIVIDNDDDDDDDLFPSVQLLMQSRKSDNEKNKSRIQLGCKIAAHCLGSNLSSEHLSSYLANCIQLNAANKINKNNAFDLQLIDYMCVLIERNDRTTNDFPTMSCSLDASARIYACRVDCAHSGIMEIATSLASIIQKSKRNESNDGIEHSDGEGANHLENRSKKRKKKNVISASREGISRNSIEEGHWVHRPAIQPDFTSLLSHASITQSENSCLSLSQDNVPLVPKRKIKQPAFENKFYSIPFDLSKGCNLLSSEWGEDELSGNGSDDNNNNNLSENNLGSVQPAETISSTLDNRSSNYNNTVVEDTTNMMNYEESASPQEQLSEKSVCYYFDSDSDSEEDVKIKETAESKKNIRRQDTLSLVNANALQAPEESIYSYFDSYLLPDWWAGPEHWKPRFKRHKPSSMTENAHEKTKKKNTRNELLSFEDLSDVDLDFNKNHVQIKLDRRVMSKWLESDMTLPLKKDYKIEGMFRSFLRKNLFFKPYLKKEEGVDEVKFEFEYADDGKIFFEDFENLGCIHDYKFEQDDQSECNEPQSPGAEDPEPTNEEQAYFETYFNRENLTSRPYITQHNTITYATVPNKLDMKLLKNTVWELLDFDPKEKDHSIVEKSSIANRQGKLLFSNIYKQLPSYLPDDMWHDTSPALVFLAVLHLANEKTLKLKSVDSSMSDIRIEKDY